MSDLHARKLIAWAPTCDTGRHNLHPGETCKEWEAYAAAVRTLYEQALVAAFAEANRQLIDGNGTGEPLGFLAMAEPPEPTPMERALAILDPELRRCPLYKAGPPVLYPANWKARP